MKNTIPVRALVAAFVLVSAALPGALSAQVLEGLLTWPGGEPLVGARATLLDESFQPVEVGISDAAGRYSITAPSPGDYVLVVDVEGYASWMSESVSVPDGAPTTLDVVFESRGVEEHNVSVADTLTDVELLAAGIAEACRGLFIPSMHGVVFGSVRDAETGSIIPSATIAATWASSNRVTLDVSRNIEVRSDNVGIYLICNAPAEEPLTLRASSHQTDGFEVTERLEVGTMSRVDLEIPLYDADAPGHIRGLVRDQQGGQVLSGVTVHIDGTDIRARSDARGVFRMPSVPWGAYTLVFEHPNYGQREQPIRVIGGRSLMVEAHLPPAPIEMPPILVTVRARRWFGDMEGLEARIERGQGFIMTRETIEQQQPRILADLLRNVPGVRVRQSGGAVSGTVTVQMRGAQDLSGRPCPPAVWVDGQKWRNPSEAYTLIMGNELEVVEVYRGPSEVPGEFLDSSASCGALIVWTRRGRTFRR
jgi:hypothetical protein